MVVGRTSVQVVGFEEERGICLSARGRERRILLLLRDAEAICNQRRHSAVSPPRRALSAVVTFFALFKVAAFRIARLRISDARPDFDCHTSARTK